jgi:hypothetical protein
MERASTDAGVNDAAAVVRRFEDEFKNAGNFAVVDELMAEGFVHHLPYPGLPAGRSGMKAVGGLVTGRIRDIRVEAKGVRADDGRPISWVENHIYRVSNGRIVELWPAGGPQL